MNIHRLYPFLLIASLLLTACVSQPPLSVPVAAQPPTAESHIVVATTLYGGQDTASATRIIEVATDSSLMPSPEISANSWSRESSTPSLDTALPTHGDGSSAATKIPDTTLNDNPNLLDYCHIQSRPTLAEATDTIYFRESDDTAGHGWYRTDDLFSTAELIAPWGILSRDLKYLVTFDCDGIGSICLASPPTEEPKVLATRYDLSYDPRNETPPFQRAFWLDDNNRLVFSASTSYRNPEDATDFTSDNRLYFLNIETGGLEQMTQNTGYDFWVSPVGECVVVRDEIDGSVNVIALQRDGVRNTTVLPESTADAFGWRSEADWSPNGQKIATSVDNVIHIVDLQTATVKTIVPCDNCAITGLRWSPDNEKLFFTDIQNLYVVIPETQSIMRVGTSWGVSSSNWTHWLSDGNSLVTTGSQSYGTMLIKLADGEKLSSYEPLILPDGTRSHVITDLFWGPDGTSKENSDSQ